MQKDGTLGVNRAKEDYLLQQFQNGKLLMINVPLPSDGGKRATWLSQLSCTPSLFPAGPSFPISPVCFETCLLWLNMSSGKRSWIPSTFLLNGEILTNDNFFYISTFHWLIRDSSLHKKSSLLPINCHKHLQLHINGLKWLSSISGINFVKQLFFVVAVVVMIDKVTWQVSSKGLFKNNSSKWIY